MSRRSSLILAGILAIWPAAVVLAQDAVQPPQVENSRYQFEGGINASSVYVRSGPGEGYYATQKLDKDARVTVVGIKFDWLKITPPEGSFSYVGSVFVDRSGDGTVGRINRNDVNIRAGSLLNAMKTTVQSRLNAGEQVQIIGKEDEYLKIKPPAGAYLYVNKQFVDPVRALGGAGDNLSTGGGAAIPVADNPTTRSSSPSVLAGGAVTPAKPTPPSIEGPVVTATPSTQPSQVAAAPTTQPIAAAPPPSAEELFGKYEAQFATMSKQPLADQAVDDLSGKYQSIAKADALSDTLRAVVQFRISTLEARAQSKAKLLEARRLEKDAAQKQLVLQAEQQELAERLKQSEVQIYTAVGTLQPSSLQLGGATLYRLTDPATVRTVVYLRSPDAAVTGLMGQFVGVKGDATTDPQLTLKVIVPTAIQAVDPAKVNGSIAAEIIPPSLLARQASASVNN